jgi:chemotaxis signal transduction protein
MLYGGREYLVRTCCSAGYQGYPGPAGWQGQVMIPLEVAFSNARSSVLAELDSGLAHGLLSHARSFCPPLFEIMGAAETIRRVVWNGQVMTAGQADELAKLKNLLEQIDDTGTRSNELFMHSIRELFETVLASGLRNSEFVSSLLGDLLDRNLYERANDCRWWALSPVLRGFMAAPDKDAVPAITRMLSHINGLYTVYTCIFVYDRNGNILASTHAGQSRTTVDSDTLKHVLALRTEQNYHVSPFEPSNMYDGCPTYVYHAAIRHPDDDAQVTGGIGIVFDASVEFSAMLRGALDKHAHVHAFFIDRQGTIIASTDTTRPIGSTLDIGESMLALDNGCSASRIVTHDDQYAVLGCTVSDGYREFKNSDGYEADVIAVVIESFGPVRERPLRSENARSLPENQPDNVNGERFATFFVDGDLLAISAAAVQEAIPMSKVSPVSMGNRPGRIGVLVLQGGSSFVWVYDLGFFLSGKTTATDTSSQVVVVRHGGCAIGLLVSELHGVAKFDAAQTIDIPLASGMGGVLVTQVIKANGGKLLIQVIGLDYLFGNLMNAAVNDDAGLLVSEAI